MVLAANSLPCFDSWLCAVCARIKLGNETFRTKTKHDGANTTFAETLSFNKQSSENTLQVKVMHCNMLRNKTIGTQDIDLNLQHYGADITRTSFELSEGGLVTGKIYLNLSTGEDASEVHVCVCVCVCVCVKRFRVQDSGYVAE